jgi:hypothetical protein
MVTRFRKVPGYFNRSTYHVEVEGRHVLDVVRAADSNWSKSAVWMTYRPGVNWTLSPRERSQSAEVRALFVCTGTSRADAVGNALRREGGS